MLASAWRAAGTVDAVNSERMLRIALVERLLRDAVALTLPGQPLQAGDDVTVTFRGVVGGAELTAEAAVQRGGELVDRAVLDGEDGLLFLFRWCDQVVE